MVGKKLGRGEWEISKIGGPAQISGPIRSNLRCADHNFHNMVLMDLAQQTSPSTLLSSLLSLYLLSEPPSPSSALPTIVTLIAEKNPFQAIEANSPALHKWNTRVSSLIQSKSAESRFWGVCLVKASIESGGEGVG